MEIIIHQAILHVLDTTMDAPGAQRRAHGADRRKKKRLPAKSH